MATPAPATSKKSTGSASPLDAPPPAPPLDPSTQPGGDNGTPVPPGMAGLAPPMSIPSGQLPPEMLTGALQRFEQMAGDLDAIAQMAPDLGAELSLLKELILQVSGKLLTAGAMPPSPTAAGAGFPAGGFGGPGM
jgi:hypothetical protein